MTPRDLLRRTSVTLFQAGIPDPETDAALLLSSLTGIAPLSLRLDMDTHLDDNTLTAFQHLLERRLTREPVQYILGETVFLGHRFKVDRRVLIPRPETELLAEMAIDALKHSTGRTALDLCCGSGCIGISLKLGVKDSRVVCTDLSPDALSLAAENADALNADVSFHEGDLFEAIPEGVFDVIVSNPPYIPSDECPSLQEEVRYEPIMALDGGTDGLAIYRRIIEEAPFHLLPNGKLMFEVGDGEADSVADLMKANGFKQIAIHKDLQHIGRMVVGEMPGAGM